MKHKYLLTLVTVPLLASLSCFRTIQKTFETSAYDRVATLPKTLNLNDLSDDAIRSYYSALNDKSDSERQGDNLLKNLKGILKNGQKYYSYDNATGKKDIWKIYEIVDRDWKKSPASAILGYDASTNTVSGYTYNGEDDPYVHALYVDRSVDNQMHAWANHNQTEWGINQEHIWAKSQGFEEEGSGGARGDIMHLWAADGKSNWLHLNYTYGYVDKTKTIEKPGDISYAQNNLRGTSKTIGSGTVFEPQDSDKGDIARALFYMAARYNNFDGDTAIDSDNPNLRLTNMTGTKESYTSSVSVVGEYGVIDDLLEWNKLDPVDEFELHRNNLCYNNYTNNRNPFIDFPEWADMIWGADKNTKSANPSTDEIARAQDYVPKTSDDTKGDNWIPGVDNKIVIIGAVVVGVVILVVVVFVLAKGNKKQKKALKKTAKKVVKSSTKSKKK